MPLSVSYDTVGPVLTPLIETSTAMISSSLRTGSPLPQISPCPLLDRFMLQYHGLDVIHKEAEDDYGLPRTLTLDTLQNEQYLFVKLTFTVLARFFK